MFCFFFGYFSDEQVEEKRKPANGNGNSKMTADDIEKYQKAVDDTSDRLRDLCDRWAAEVERGGPTLNEEVVQKVHSVTGKSQLLRTSKFKQFRGFLRDAADKTVGRPVLLDDVRGFWETIYIQVEEVLRAFDELERIKADGYVISSATTVTDGVGGLCPSRKVAKKATTTTTTAAAASAKKPVVAASSSLKNFISAQRERKKLNEVGDSGNSSAPVSEKVPSNGHV